MSPLEVAGEAGTSSANHWALRPSGPAGPRQLAGKLTTAAPACALGHPELSPPLPEHLSFLFPAFSLPREATVTPGTASWLRGTGLQGLLFGLIFKSASQLLASGSELPPESGVFYLYVSGFI